jgi:hypothetical protein
VCIWPKVTSTTAGCTTAANPPRLNRYGRRIARLWPYRAGRNVYQMLNPGGYVLVTTPFLIRIHDQPVDCSRWTELGLKHLLAECGFPMKNIRTGSWGNRACVIANFTEWPHYAPQQHSLDNEPNFPLVVWALAQKDTH